MSPSLPSWRQANHRAAGLPPLPLWLLSRGRSRRRILDLCPGLLRQEREAFRLAGPYSPHAAEGPRNLRIDPGRRLRPTEVEGHPANAHQRWPQQGLHQQLVPIIPRMFKWAAADELVPGTVYHALRTVEGLRKGRTEAHETKPVLPVEDALVEATLPYLPAIVAAMVKLSAVDGCRPGEVCQVRPCDVDRSGEVWQYRPESHKTEHHGRDRIIYIGPQAQAVLRPYLLRDPQANCFQPVESEQQRHVEQRKRRRTRVQPSQRNRRKARPTRAPRTAYTKDSYQTAIARAIVKGNKDRTKAAAGHGCRADPAAPLARQSATPFQGDGNPSSVRLGSRPSHFGPRQGRRYSGLRRAGQPAWPWRLRSRQGSITIGLPGCGSSRSG